MLLAQKITRKNVVRIFDIGEDQGTKFITMDFIEGVDLKHVLRERGKFPPREALAIIRQVCLALDAAHTEGVVHRDLKPPLSTRSETPTGDHVSFHELLESPGRDQEV